MPNVEANINRELGLLFQADSQMLAGIRDKLDPATRDATLQKINGTLIAARSDNDTANNPHNPMYAVARAFLNAGTDGGVVSLIGSRNSDSGGNSVAPPRFMDAELRPAKVDRASDVTGMVDVGNLVGILEKEDIVGVMESMTRLTGNKLGAVNTGLPSRDAVIKEMVQCGYLTAADLADRFANVPVDPSEDPLIFGPNGGTAIFDEDDAGDREFRKTAAVMKMVIDGHAGAGTITMGGYDYHTGDRVTGERRDERAGRCMGACIEYAKRKEVPLLIYVFSDGSVFSNGTPDAGAGNKGVWTGDNSGTAGSFMLLYDHHNGVRPVVDVPQIGWYSRAGAVVTGSSPAGNNVNQLVHTFLMNYMSASGMIAPDNMSAFLDIFGPGQLNFNHGLGDLTNEAYVRTLMSLPPITPPPPPV